VILVLGGTAEARLLAAALDEQGVAVTTSLAGRVARPRLPPGAVRIGGFGGAEGLVAWLRQHRVQAVVDATHPFAERISASAVAACSASGVAILRLERPGWSERPGDRWTWVDDLGDAARAIAGLGERVLLTTGRQGLPAFASVGDAWFVIRCVDPPEPPLPGRHELILDRGPYTVDGELELIDRHRVDLIVTKDSGGSLTVAKLDAARERGLPVIVVRRPPRAGGPGSTSVTEVGEALEWALAHAEAHAG
jgi:precorrin-6A/cobalt-precorrin-6A reductase